MLSLLLEYMCVTLFLLSEKVVQKHSQASLKKQTNMEKALHVRSQCVILWGLEYQDDAPALGCVGPCLTSLPGQFLPISSLPIENLVSLAISPSYIEYYSHPTRVTFCG